MTPLESQPCVRSIQSWIGTMMQSYASRVWLQSCVPILPTGINAMVCYQVATTPDLPIGPVSLSQFKVMSAIDSKEYIRVRGL